MQNLQRYLVIPITLLVLSLGLPVIAQDDMVDIVNDEGGPISIRGMGDYTFPSFDIFLPEPYILLVDISGSVVERDLDFYPSAESQVFGTVTSERSTSPVTYTLDLPVIPRGETRDVDNDNNNDTGVMIFGLTVASNTWGNPFFEERDFYNTGVLSSIIISPDSETLGELVGGKLLIYAPEDNQGFPFSFGDDGLLFTGDDPVVTVPEGYTIVDLDVDPFTFERTREATIDLIESELAALDDFSDMDFVAGFDSMVELLSREYAFTEYANINWNALNDEFRPLVEAAAARDDLEAYRTALLSFSYRIPDPHVYGLLNPSVDWQGLLGGLGMYLVQLDSGLIVAYGVQDEGAAANAGIVDGAEILEINGQKIADRVASAQSISLNSIGASHIMRLEKLRWALRFDIGDEVDVTFRNPGEESMTATLLADFEVDTLFSFPLTPTPDPNALPVSFEINDDNFMVVKFISFSDDLPLTIHLWERMIQTSIINDVAGIIIDMRANTGGSGYIADATPAYFFDEELLLGQTAIYSADIDDFFVAEELESKFVLPPDELYYRGPVAVLVGPDCASACESFAYNMTLQDRAVIVGHYPTVGAGGSVVPIALPGDLQLYFSRGRGLDAEGNIHIQNVGVVPDVRVPLTEETLFSEDDAVMQAAVEALRSGAVVSADAGQVVQVDDSISTVIPANWTEIAPGTYGNNAETQALLIVTLPVGEIDLALNALTRQGLILSEVYDQLTYGDLDWLVYETNLDGVMGRMGITEGRGVVYIMMLLAEKDLDMLTATVLTLALENFTVE